MIKEIYPWEHIIIEDFYDEMLFNNMRTEILNFFHSLSDPEVREEYAKRIHKFEKRLFGKKLTLRETELLDDVFPETKKCLASKNIDESFLLNFTKHREYENLSKFDEINILLDDLKYPIHDENPSKICSIVTYVAPNKGNGTDIYDKSKNFVKQIEWKPNRMFAFCGLDGITWHGYDCIPNSYRITINTFLVSDERMFKK